MDSDKSDGWINYSVAAGASFAYFLALPSFTVVDKNLIIISSYLFGLSLIWNTLLSVGLRKDKKLNTIIYEGLGRVGYQLFFFVPLLVFGLAIVCYIWSISDSIALFMLSGLFIFFGILNFSTVRADTHKKEDFFISEKSSVLPSFVSFFIALLLGAWAVQNI